MRGQLLFQHFSLTKEDYLRPCSKDKHGALKLLVAAKHTGSPLKFFIFNILFLTKFVHLSLWVYHMSADAQGGKKKHSWHWSGRSLWAARYVLGAKQVCFRSILPLSLSASGGFPYVSCVSGELRR